MKAVLFSVPFGSAVLPALIGTEALLLTAALILYVHLCLRPMEVLNAEKARVQAAVPVSAQVKAVTMTAPDQFCAELSPDTGACLPAELTLDFRTPVAEGQRVKLWTFADSTPPAVMTKEDFLAYCCSIEERQKQLDRKKRYPISLLVTALLLAALAVGIRTFLSALG